MRSPVVNAPALALDGVCVETAAGSPPRRLLEVDALSVHAGERVAVVGANGAGKSTLLALLAGLPLPGARVRGRVTVLGRVLAGGSAGDPAGAAATAPLAAAGQRALRAEIGLVRQGLHLVPRLSALDNVLVGALARPAMRGAHAWRAWLRLPPPALVHEAMAALDRLGMAGRAGQRADRLSGGERQKVGVARVLLQRPRLVLADEPTAALDPASTHAVLAMLAEAPREASRQGTLLAVVHQASLLPALADRVIGLKQGRIVFDRPTAQVDAGLLQALYADGPHEHTDRHDTGLRP